MHIRLVLAALTAIALAACVPENYHYYLPEASSGELHATHGTCNDVKDAIGFTDPSIPGVLIDLRVTGSGSMTYVSIGIRSSDWQQHDWLPKTVEFSEDHLTLVGADGQRTPLKLEFPGGDRTKYRFQDGYGYEVRFTQPPGDHFTIEVPPIAFDGRTVAVPRIRFTPTSTHTLTGINC